jgi:hypothetical protein
MRVGRSEAIDIFRAWASARLIVRVEGSFRAGFSFAMEGRVLFVGDPSGEGEVRLLADNTSSECNVRLNNPMEIYYNDNRVVEGSAKEFREAITLAFESVEGREADDLDHITVAAIEAVSH